MINRDQLSGKVLLYKVSNPRDTILKKSFCTSFGLVHLIGIVDITNFFTPTFITHSLLMMLFSSIQRIQCH